ncbi:hypothetical protein KI387_004696, partial [Taxus chinensis]
AFRLGVDSLRHFARFQPEPIITTMALSRSGQASYPKNFYASHSSFFGSNLCITHKV